MKTKSSLPMTQTEFIRRYKQNKKLVIFLRVLILVLFFLLWEGAARLFLIDPFIFSSPGMIWRPLLCSCQSRAKG